MVAARGKDRIIIFAKHDIACTWGGVDIWWTADLLLWLSQLSRLCKYPGWWHRA
jgi:hypothetical protein